MAYVKYERIIGESIVIEVKSEEDLRQYKREKNFKDNLISV